jgi:integrase
MAMNVQLRGTKFQLRVIHTLLPRPFFHTFLDKDEALRYGTQLESLLYRGIIPQEILIKLNTPKAVSDLAVWDLIESYETSNHAISNTDKELLGYIKPIFSGTRLSQVTFQFVLTLVNELIVHKNLSPGTIRARIGCLGRIWDWHIAHHSSKMANPWRQLPQGYSLPSDNQKIELIRAKKKPKIDTHRDRRLYGNEEARILRVLRGEKIRPDRERRLEPNPELELMFRLIVDTGMRLRECYTLSRSQIVLTEDENYIAVNGTKGHRGALKPRTIPLLPKLRQLLSLKLESMPPDETRLFPGIWTGTKDANELKRISNLTSKLFATVFEHANCVDITEHDLRHEACCRLVLLRFPNGHWVYSTSEIAVIMGWSSLSLFLRYASLRGSDLSGRLDQL